jgi:hypothetical protein
VICCIGERVYGFLSETDNSSHSNDWTDGQMGSRSGHGGHLSL